MKGKDGKIRWVAAASGSDGTSACLPGDRSPEPGPGQLFRSLRGRSAGAGITANGAYQLVRYWAKAAGIAVRPKVHTLRATAATNDLEEMTTL